MKKSKSLEYTNLKKSLESLGYNEQLGPDSIFLVNHLLTDIINNSDALKKSQEEKEKLSLELKKQGNLLLPLRKENIRITKENNDLHNQMIQLEDNLDKFKIVNSEYYKKVEQERDDYKILINQKESLIKKQLNEIDELKKKCTELFDKINFGNRNQQNLYKTTTNVMFTKNNKPTNINTNIIGAMELSENLKDENNNENAIELFKNELQNFNFNKESWANDLKQADREAEKLRNEIRNLKKELEEKERNIKNYKNQIDSRDNEINKLQMNKFIGDDNMKELEIKYDSANLKEENEKLKLQIDVLNKENHKLQEKEYFHSHRCREEEIKKLENIINGLNKENDILQKKILESENKFVINKEKNDINYQNNLAKLNDEIKNLNGELKKMNNIRINLEKENAILKDKISSLNLSAQKREESKKIYISEQDTEKANLNKIIEELKLNLKEVNNQNKDLIISLKSMKEKNEKLSNEILKIRSESMRIDQKISQNKYNLLLSDFKEIEKNKENLEKTNLNLQKQLIILQDELKQVNDTNKTLSQTVYLKDTSLKELNKANSELNIKIKNIESSLTKTQMNFRINDNRLNMVNNDKDILNKLITELKDTISNLNKKIGILEESNKELNKNNSGLVVENQNLNEQINKLINDNNDMKMKITEKDVEVVKYKKINNDINEYKKKYEILFEQKQNLEKENNNLMFEINNLKSEIINITGTNEQLIKEAKLNEVKIKEQNDIIIKNNNLILVYETQCKKYEHNENNLLENNSAMDTMKKRSKIK